LVHAHQLTSKQEGCPDLAFINRSKERHQPAS
jgi:hypothetical protein